MSRFKITAALLLCLFGAAATAAPAAPTAPTAKKQTYRWVDANGQVHYGDKVPPQDAKQGRQNINNQGVITKVVPRELTPDERVAADAQAKLQAQAQEAHEKQVAYDRYLVQSYASVADIQAVRTDRLAVLDAKLQLAQKSVDDTEKYLTSLRGQQPASGKPDSALAKKIDTYEATLVESLQAVRSLREERSNTELKFASDIDRYKKLKSGVILPGG